MIDDVRYCGSRTKLDKKHIKDILKQHKLSTIPCRIRAAGVPWGKKKGHEAMLSDQFQEAGEGAVVPG
jgi:hypothetical protein